MWGDYTGPVGCAPLQLRTQRSYTTAPDAAPAIVPPHGRHRHPLPGDAQSSFLLADFVPPYVCITGTHSIHPCTYILPTYALYIDSTLTAPPARLADQLCTPRPDYIRMYTLHTQ
jgi:hypothetical protein